MAQIIATATAPVHAPAHVAYDILTDYVDGHPRILPRPSFGALTVERGGRGAGTVFRVQALQGFSMKTYHMEASEPEPGRVLMERDLDSDLVTTFTVDPVDGGASCRVTIETRWTRDGLRGVFDRLLSRLAGPVLLKEIRNLEALARERAVGPLPPAPSPHVSPRA